jgi:iron complex outermembrane receptor protein
MKSLFITSACLAAIMVAGSPATAQQQSAAAEGATAKLVLEEVVVTAQRREESLQRAAIAVSVISGDELRAAGITRPTELTAIVPSLQVTAAAGPYSLFYLRGVGNFNSNAFSDSAVAFNFDGVFLGRPSSTVGFFYDLKRVEVVKGPQGTLYGRNATGGAINVISKTPELGKLSGDASAEFGSYGAVRVDAALNLPLGEKSAVRFAGISVKHDGYMNDDTDDQDDRGGRVSLLVEPTDTLQISAVVDYFKQGGKGPGSTPLLAPAGVPSPAIINVDDRIGFFSPQGQAFYTSQFAATLGRTFYPFPAGYGPFQDNHWWGASSTINWKSSHGTLTVIPAYREGRLDYLGYTPGFQVRQGEDNSQTSVEARFATNEDRPLRAILGGFYYKEATTDPFTAYVSNWNGQFDSDLKLDTKSNALFGRLTYAVTPDLRLNVGARRTTEDKNFSGQRLSFTRICLAPPGGCANAPPLPFGAVPPPGRVTGLVSFVPPVLQAVASITQREQRKFNKTTWRVGADWEITPQKLLYASFETGFKAGGFYISPGSGVFEPETIQAFTIGSKNRFLDSRLQFNFELFHWRYKDQQISHLINIAGVPTFATENVGRATFSGFEIETKMAVTDRMTLSADVQYLEAKYDAFVFRQANTGGATSLTAFNGTACPTTGFDPATNNSFIVDCGARRPANAPEWTLNLGGQQVLPVASGEFVLDARAHYQSETLTGLEFLPVEFQPGYWQADAALTYYTPERRYYVGAFVNNLTDETIQAQNFPTPGTSIFGTQLRPPRTYGIRAGLKF